MLKRNPSIQKRRAVTILEVLFSIMIVMVGLVGIAALLPVALRQAGDSFALSRSAILSHSVAQHIIASEIKNPASVNWLIPDDVSSGKFLRWDFKNMTDVNEVNVAPLGIKPLKMGICIDPLFWSAQPGAMSGIVPLCNGTEGAYRRSRFPYFREDFSALNDPDNNAFSAAPVMILHPRMIRVSLQANGNGNVPMPSLIADEHWASNDDFINDPRTNDPNLPFRDRERPFSRLYFGSQAKAASTREFSWMATLSPLVTGKDLSYYKLAVVIFHHRDRTFNGGKLTTQGVAYDAASPPDAERIMDVSPIGSSSSGGAGFSIKLSANVKTNSSLKVGDWLMLSKNESVSTAVAITTPVFNWYRVSAVSQETVTGSVWSRVVQVTGTDWTFDSHDTTATIVSNVASVYERVISIQ